MKKKIFTLVLAVTLLAVMLSTVSLATEANNSAEKTRLEAIANGKKEMHPHPEADWLDWFHNPAPWLEMGADFRFRTITARNIDTLDEDPAGRGNKWNFQRYRSRWWTKSKLSDDVDFNTRMVWEFRTWDEPARKPQHTDFDEIIFDRLNFTMRNLFDMPLTGVFGRQDIILGKGWLMLDGTPLDGSRTIFTDAARLTYDWTETDTKIDMIYIDMAASAARWLKPINDRNHSLTEQDEYGAILYVTNKSLENTQLEGYVMYKNDNPVDQTPKNFPPTWSRKAEIFTFGGAASGDIDKNWNYRAEGAIQTGQKDDTSGDSHDLQAYGATTRLNYNFNDICKNNLHIGYEYLSGNDPSTDDDEQFDPLWGEWPQWSELYVYTYSRETAIGETTNLHRAYIGHSFKPAPKWTLNTDYHLLWADESPRKGTSVGTDSFTYSNSGDFRGQLLTCWAKYKFSKQLKGHLLAEYLIPGNYYDRGNRSHAYFLRFNVEYTF